MGRTLPWLVNGPTTKAPASTKRAVPGKASAARKRQKTEDEVPKYDRAQASDGEPSTLSHFGGCRQDYDIFSSSPPPVERPVQEEFMRQGLDADDIYIMVEDEFYDVARTFTAHIHQQEYERLRREARDRNASRTTSVARPVDGKTVLPKDKKMAKDRKAMGAERKEKLASLMGPADSDTDVGEEHVQDDRWAGTTLGGLMMSPSKAQRSLVGLQGPTIRSRAAAGFKEAQVTPSRQRTVVMPNPRDDKTVSSDDDLDASPLQAPRTKPAMSKGYQSIRRRDTSPVTRVKQEKDQGIGSSRKSGSGGGKSFLKSSDTRGDSGASVKVPIDLESDDLDNFLRPTPIVNDRRKAGQQTKLNTKDTIQKKRNYDEIPMFLG